MEGGGKMRAHDGGGPVDGSRPFSEPERKVLGLHCGEGMVELFEGVDARAGWFGVGWKGGLLSVCGFVERKEYMLVSGFVICIVYMICRAMSEIGASVKRVVTAPGNPYQAVKVPTRLRPIPQQPNKLQVAEYAKSRARARPL